MNINTLQNPSQELNKIYIASDPEYMRRWWNKEKSWHYFSFASNGYLDVQEGNENKNYHLW